MARHKAGRSCSMFVPPMRSETFGVDCSSYSPPGGTTQELTTWARGRIGGGAPRARRGARLESAMTAPPLVEVRGLMKIYTEGDRERVVLRGVDASIRRGELAV